MAPRARRNGVVRSDESGGLRADQGPRAERAPNHGSAHRPRNARQVHRLGLLAGARPNAGTGEPSSFCCARGCLGRSRSRVPTRGGATMITLTVNGAETKLDVDPEMP